MPACRRTELWWTRVRANPPASVRHPELHYPAPQGCLEHALQAQRRVKTEQHVFLKSPKRLGILRPLLSVD